MDSQKIDTYKDVPEIKMQVDVINVIVANSNQK